MSTSANSAGSVAGDPLHAGPVPDVEGQREQDVRPELVGQERSRSVRRAAAITRSPRAANLRAAAAPKPELAPVMSTVRTA